MDGGEEESVDREGGRGKPLAEATGGATAELSAAVEDVEVVLVILLSREKIERQLHWLLSTTLSDRRSIRVLDKWEQ